MNRIAEGLIRFYQRWISPLYGSGKCKYQPTCSQYALEAFRRYRFTTACCLSLWRILRCNPFSKGGKDPLR
uniref:membrane protein insertion efficiency factor YidD n=1 Tax=Ndongobacter massiliensis TaxID=1871025 RepID=UPI000A9A4DCB|nr:membrane protein insertion efficiency factor YidD [Ndongobacter massiliensis]